MATEVKLRRGTASAHESFTGAAGEMTIDTTNNRAVVHDGLTAGGHPHYNKADVDALLDAINTALSGKQASNANLTAIAALTTQAFGRGLLTLADAAALRSAASVLSAAASVALHETGNFTPVDLEVIDTGTITPEPSDGQCQFYTNGGAHTLAPPTETGAFLLYMTNNADAGVVTTSDFDVVRGDTLTTTNGDKFEFAIVNNGTISILQITDLN